LSKYEPFINMINVLIKESDSTTLKMMNCFSFDEKNVTAFLHYLADYHGFYFNTIEIFCVILNIDF
jgi:hypothetical protein